MKKQIIAIILAGLAATTVFANDDANTQQNNNQAAPSMEVQPQVNSGAQQTSPNNAMSGNGIEEQTAPQDSTGSQD